VSQAQSDLEIWFPNLSVTGYVQTSPFDPRYNCIAWAAGCSDRWWEPDPLEIYYWPPGAPRSYTVDSYVAAFGTLGYAPTDDNRYVSGIEKVAIYAVNRRPTHAARQLSTDTWTSKCGRSEDISHTLAGLVSDLYGAPVMILSRRVP
jgi:hypothetical protein